MKVFFFSHTSLEMRKAICRFSEFRIPSLIENGFMMVLFVCIPRLKCERFYDGFLRFTFWLYGFFCHLFFCYCAEG